jgi:hypothetical protein
MMRRARLAIRWFGTTDQLLHVTNGDSVAASLRQTSLGGSCLAWNDVLHEGPVPTVPRAELLDVRAAFLSDCGWGSRNDIRSSLEQRDRRYVRALRDRLQVVLWFEHDLYDQLQLIDALTLADEADVLPELIVISAFPGKPSFHGLGELDLDELETLWPSRRSATTSEAASARAAWDAVRAPEPVPLAAIVDEGAGGSPVLAAALLRLLEELPAPATGLTGTERRTLEAIAAGADTASAAFRSLEGAEEAPFLGDTWFFRSLAGLHGLVETHKGGPLPAQSPTGWRTPLRLTEAGGRVLRGEADRVDLIGIDRWVGGTHITTENAWRWDSAKRGLLPPV